MDAYAQLFDVFIVRDIEQEGYLHHDWMQNDEIFIYALNAYIRIRKSTGRDPDTLQTILLQELAGLLTYRSFTVPQVKALVEQLPFGFNPRQSQHPSGLSHSLLDTAKCYCNQDVAEYLESLSPAPLTSPQELSFNPLDFQGMLDLLSQDPSLSESTENGFIKLNTLTEICVFFGVQPDKSLSAECFQGEMLSMRNLYPSATTETILKHVKEVYQKLYETCQSIKSLFLTENIPLYCTQNMVMDKGISGSNTFFKSNVGKFLFQGKLCVYKYESTISYASGYELPFSKLQTLADFIEKTRNLKRHVPHVVEVLPYILLNKTRQNIQIGYLMELAPGKTLRHIPALSQAEGQTMQNQFNDAVDKMIHAGYALYDFHEDNILWDGERLTFIDLSSAGFKPEALAYADTMAVKYRMSEMLAQRTACRPIELGVV